MLRWLADACSPGNRILAPPPSGWERVPRLARRHRISGLLSQRLSPLADRVPPTVSRLLREDREASTAVNLQAALACRALAHALAQEAPLPFLFIKGLTLSSLAYGDPFLKVSNDIDLLVLPEDVSRAAAILARLGYRPIEPGSAADIPRWHRRMKESVWKSAGGLPVELHTRLNDHPAIMAEVTARTPSLLVDITPDLRLPTLPEPLLLAYLCVHGASSGWFRLKWVADLFALLSSKAADEITALHQQASQWQADRAVGVGLLLCRLLFDLPLSAEFEDRLKRNGATIVAVNAALAQLEAAQEPTDRPLGTVGIHLSQLLLGPGWTFPFREGWRKAQELTVRRLITR